MILSKLENETRRLVTFSHKGSFSILSHCFLVLCSKRVEFPAHKTIRVTSNNKNPFV